MKRILLSANLPITVVLSPVVNGDVPLQIKLPVMELDHRETSAAHHMDFVHAGDTARKDCRHEIQDLGWSGSRQVNVRQDGVLRAAIVRHALPCLKLRQKRCLRDVTFLDHLLFKTMHFMGNFFMCV